VRSGTQVSEGSGRLLVVATGTQVRDHGMGAVLVLGMNRSVAGLVSSSGSSSWLVSVSAFTAAAMRSEPLRAVNYA
jgi:hypothetical protein